MVVGDADQCFVPGTPVTMADRTTRPIEQVVAGDQVLSCYGSGDFRPARVHARAPVARGRRGNEDHARQRPRARLHPRAHALRRLPPRFRCELRVVRAPERAPKRGRATRWSRRSRRRGGWSSRCATSGAARGRSTGSSCSAATTRARSILEEELGLSSGPSGATPTGGSRPRARTWRRSSTIVERIRARARRRRRVHRAARAPRRARRATNTDLPFTAGRRRSSRAW